MSYRTDSSQPFQPHEGQYVSCMHSSWAVRRTGIVVAVVPPASAPGHDFVGYVVQYPTSTDEHPAVQALAIYNGHHRGLFRAEELQPVSSDDAPTATAAEVVEHITGVRAPESSNVDEYICPVEDCDFHIMAAGPVDIDEPDYYQEEVDAHVRSHEPERVIHSEWSTVGAVDLWLAVQEAPAVFDAVAHMLSVPPADVARALRSVADVLDGGAR